MLSDTDCERLGYAIGSGHAPHGKGCVQLHVLLERRHETESDVVVIQAKHVAEIGRAHV